MSKPYAFVEGGHYYDVDWQSGQLILSQKQDNGELFIDQGQNSNVFLVEGEAWTDLHVSEVPALLDPPADLVFAGSALTLAPATCTCGTEAVGGSIHSSWCDTAGVGQ